VRLYWKKPKAEWTFSEHAVADLKPPDERRYVERIDYQTPAGYDALLAEQLATCMPEMQDVISADVALSLLVYTRGTRTKAKADGDDYKAATHVYFYGVRPSPYGHGVMLLEFADRTSSRKFPKLADLRGMLLRLKTRISEAVSVP